MEKILLILFLLFFSQPIFSQQVADSLSFSNSLTQFLPKYNMKAKDAYYHRDFNKAKQLFKSLVNNHLKNSYMDNFTFYNIKGKPIELYSFEKPIYLMTCASWCIPTSGEIPAINELANKYSNQVDFVVIFWDDQKTTRELAKSYNKKIQIFYVNEMKNQDSFVISQLKHSLGLPTTFLIDSNKKILDIKREISHPYGISQAKSYDMNYDYMHNSIANELLAPKGFEQNLDPVASN
ncbi:MAG: TlpA disulfide reductase family protein, partial [Gillisia sp.]